MRSLPRSQNDRDQKQHHYQLILNLRSPPSPRTREVIQVRSAAMQPNRGHWVRPCCTHNEDSCSIAACGCSCRASRAAAADWMSSSEASLASAANLISHLTAAAS